LGPPKQKSQGAQAPPPPPPGSDAYADKPAPRVLEASQSH